MQEFSLSRFLDLAAVGAIMRVSLFVSVAGAVSLMARMAHMRRAGNAAMPAMPDSPDSPDSPDAKGGGVSNKAKPGGGTEPSQVILAGPLSWFAILSPAAPLFAFVILFEIEAAQAFLAFDCGGPGEDCLTRVLVWPAFVFVGLGVLAASISLARRMRRRLGGRALWAYGLLPLATGLLAALFAA